jgi:hypothetical protein
MLTQIRIQVIVFLEKIFQCLKNAPLLSDGVAWDKGIKELVEGYKIKRLVLDG